MGITSLKFKRLWLPSVLILAVILTLIILLPGLIYPNSIQGNSAPPLQSSTATPTATPTIFLDLSMATMTPTGSSLPVSELTAATNDCTYTTFFWRGFPERWIIENIVIGETSFTQDEAIAILAMEALDERAYLLQQFIAALLNTLKGADSGAVEAVMINASDWLNSHPEGVKIPARDRQEALNYATALAQYNNGFIGPGHCLDEPVPPTPTSTPSPTATQTPTATPIRTLKTPTNVPRPTDEGGQDEPAPTEPAPTDEPTQAQPTNTQPPKPSNTPRPPPTEAPTESPPTEPPQSTEPPSTAAP